MDLFYVLGYIHVCFLNSREVSCVQRVTDCNLPPLQLDLDNLGQCHQICLSSRLSLSELEK